MAELRGAGGLGLWVQVQFPLLASSAEASRWPTHSEAQTSALTPNTWTPYFCLLWGVHTGHTQERTPNHLVGLWGPGNTSSHLHTVRHHPA